MVTVEKCRCTVGDTMYTAVGSAMTLEWKRSSESKHTASRMRLLHANTNSYTHSHGLVLRSPGLLISHNRGLGGWGVGPGGGGQGRATPSLYCHCQCAAKSCSASRKMSCWMNHELPSVLRTNTCE